MDIRNVGARVRKKRKALGLTLEKLAELVKASKTIGEVEVLH